MTKENKLRQEIISKFNIQPSLLNEVNLTNSTEQKNKFFNELKDFINFIRCYVLLKIVKNEENNK